MDDDLMREGAAALTNGNWVPTALSFKMKVMPVARKPTTGISTRKTIRARIEDRKILPRIAAVKPIARITTAIAATATLSVVGENVAKGQSRHRADDALDPIGEASVLFTTD